MGRFDALTNLDGKQQAVNPPADSPTLSIQKGQSSKEKTKEIKKPANPQTGKTANPLTRKPANPLFVTDIQEKPEKYTTRLFPSIVKKLRLFAIDKDMKDYEVVTNALNEYIEKNK